MFFSSLTHTSRSFRSRYDIYQLESDVVQYPWVWQGLCSATLAPHTNLHPGTDSTVLSCWHGGMEWLSKPGGKHEFRDILHLAQITFSCKWKNIHLSNTMTNWPLRATVVWVRPPFTMYITLDLDPWMQFYLKRCIVVTVPVRCQPWLYEMGSGGTTKRRLAMLSNLFLSFQSCPH